MLLLCRVSFAALLFYALGVSGNAMTYISDEQEALGTRKSITCRGQGQFRLEALSRFVTSARNDSVAIAVPLAILGITADSKHLIQRILLKFSYMNKRKYRLNQGKRVRKMHRMYRNYISTQFKTHPGACVYSFGSGQQKWGLCCKIIVGSDTEFYLSCVPLSAKLQRGIAEEKCSPILGAEVGKNTIMQAVDKEVLHSVEQYLRSPDIEKVGAAIQYATNFETSFQIVAKKLHRAHKLHGHRVESVTEKLRSGKISASLAELQLEALERSVYKKTEISIKQSSMFMSSQFKAWSHKLENREKISLLRAVRFAMYNIQNDRLKAAKELKTAKRNKHISPLHFDQFLRDVHGYCNAKIILIMTTYQRAVRDVSLAQDREKNSKRKNRKVSMWEEKILKAYAERIDPAEYNIAREVVSAKKAGRRTPSSRTLLLTDSSPTNQTSNPNSSSAIQPYTWKQGGTSRYYNSYNYRGYPYGYCTSYYYCTSADTWYYDVWNVMSSYPSNVYRNSVNGYNSHSKYCYSMWYVWHFGEQTFFTPELLGYYVSSYDSYAAYSSSCSYSCY